MRRQKKAKRDYTFYNSIELPFHVVFMCDASLIKTKTKRVKRLHAADSKQKSYVRKDNKNVAILSNQA